MNSNKGIYVPPKRIEIAGLTTLVVDPHNEVLPFWYTINRAPSVVVHVDDHSDMSAGSRTFENAKRGYTFSKITSLEDFARECLGIEQFISVAMQDNQVGAVYHLAPRQNKIEAYGRIRNGCFSNVPKTIVDNSGRIKWADGKLLPTPEKISEQELLQEIKGTTYPVILDIDLDAFHLNQVDSVGHDYSNQLEKVRRQLHQLPRPEVITIARSQTPTTYVNPKLVHKIETDCIKMLEEVYKR